MLTTHNGAMLSHAGGFVNLTEFDKALNSGTDAVSPAMIHLSSRFV